MGKSEGRPTPRRSGAGGLAEFACVGPSHHSGISAPTRSAKRDQNSRRAIKPCPGRGAGGLSLRADVCSQPRRATARLRWGISRSSLSTRGIRLMLLWRPRPSPNVLFRAERPPRTSGIKLPSLTSPSPSITLRLAASLLLCTCHLPGTSPLLSSWRLSHLPEHASPWLPCTAITTSGAGRGECGE